MSLPQIFLSNQVTMRQVSGNKAGVRERPKASMEMKIKHKIKHYRLFSLLNYTENLIISLEKI